MYSLNRLLLLVVTCFSLTAQAQLTTNTSIPVAQMVQDALLGPGVSVSNVTYTGFGSAIASFDGSNTVLGFDAGMILTTGTAKDSTGFGRLGPHGPNDQPLSGLDNLFPGDSLLSTLDNSMSGTFNSAVLEFDVVPFGDSITVNYIFGSEEYPEFAPPLTALQFNDVFGIFISGPGINGVKNIALLPGDTVPVSIATINPAQNASLYVDNGNGATAPQNTDSAFVQYDGHTTILHAASAVVPGETYHIVIGISDVADGVGDSGIFLEAGSFAGNGSIAFTTIDIEVDQLQLTEGCDSTSLALIRTSDLSVADTVLLSYTGSATLGVDYNVLPDTLIFPISEDSLNYVINAQLDSNLEGPETIEITAIVIQQNFVNDTSSFVIQIDDIIPLALVVSSDTLLTCGDSTHLTANASGGCGPLTIQWNNGLIGTDITELISPLTTTTYTVTVTDLGSGQTISDSVVVMIPNVAPLSLSIVPGDTTVDCPQTPVDLLGEVTGGTPPYTWSWDNGDMDSLTTLFFPVTDSILLIVTDSCNISTSEISVVTVTYDTANASLLQAMFTATPPFAEVDSFINFDDWSLGNPTQWAWDFGDGNTATIQNPSHSYSSAGTYDVCLIVSDACYSDTVCQSITISAANPLVAQFTVVANNLSVEFTDASTPAGTITAWNWDFGDGTTSAIQNPTHTYTTEGMFNACLVIEDGTFSDSVCNSVNVLIDGIHEAGWLNEVNLFPNPTQGLLNLSLQTPAQEALSINLYDLSGKHILKQNFGTSTKQLQLDLSILENGLYHLVLSTPSGFSKRFPVSVMR